MAARRKPKKTVRTKRTGMRAGKRAPARKMGIGGLSQPKSQQAGMSADTGLNQAGIAGDSPDAIGSFQDSSWGAYRMGAVGTMVGITATEGEDMLTDTQKVTAGYFPNGGGTLLAADIYTGSLATSNEKYYFNITQAHPASASAETQFSVAYGNAGGSGSDTDNGDVQGATKAIYGQWASRLLDESEISGGFRISSGGGGTKPTSAVLSAGVRDEDIYVLVGKRERYKDRINKKNWTISLSGSLAMGSGSTLTLTDDSDISNGTSTVAGMRYNIVSGTYGTVATEASERTFGWFYPEQGAMIFSQVELSASMGGPSSGSAGFSASAGQGDFSGTQNVTASFVKGGGALASGSMGFAPNLDANSNPRNALRFVNCLQQGSAKLRFRSEEDQVSVSYFCRVRAKDLNFSNNPTFVSGSSNEIRKKDMWGNPNVYITGIGLYGANNQLVAIGKLSTPLKKNFGTEETVKVKLTY